MKRGFDPMGALTWIHGGPLYFNYTDSNGKMDLNCVFGKRIYGEERRRDPGEEISRDDIVTLGK